MVSVTSASSLGPLATIVGWYFVPSILASLVLKGFYTVFPHQQPLIYDTAPKPETIAAADAKARRHGTLSHTFVVVVYLAYTLSTAFQSLRTDTNHYRLLGLPVTPLASVTEEVWDRELKQRWRTLVKTAHPDKVGHSNQDTFVAMRVAYETLSHPLKKDAYDRFGPDVVLQCGSKCATMHEYMGVGLFSSSAFYIVVMSTLVLLNLAGRNEEGAYWRIVFLAALAAAEFSVVTRPAGILIQLAALAGMAPWQLVVLLHHIYVAATMAVGQLGPLLFPRPKAGNDMVGAMAPVIGRVHQLAQECDMEAFMALHSDIQPVLDLSNTPEAAQTNTAIAQHLKEGMLEVLIDAALRNDSQSSNDWRQAIKEARSRPSMKEEPASPDMSVLDDLTTVPQPAGSTSVKAEASS